MGTVKEFYAKFRICLLEKRIAGLFIVQYSNRPVICKSLNFSNFEHFFFAANQKCKLYYYTDL